MPEKLSDPPHCRPTMISLTGTGTRLAVFAPLPRLGLVVVDRHTGEERSPRSLSGGETFYTSLALALGREQVIQQPRCHVLRVRLDRDFGIGREPELRTDRGDDSSKIRDREDRRSSAAEEDRRHRPRIIRQARSRVPDLLGRGTTPLGLRAAPGLGVTIAASARASRFIRPGLPALGRPTSTRTRAGARTSRSSRRSPAPRATRCASRSRSPASRCT